MIAGILHSLLYVAAAVLAVAVYLIAYRYCNQVIIPRWRRRQAAAPGPPWHQRWLTALRNSYHRTGGPPAQEYLAWRLTLSNRRVIDLAINLNDWNCAYERALHDNTFLEVTDTSGHTLVINPRYVLFVESKPGLNVSSAESVLAAL